MKIIIVDDIEENRYLLETLLNANGYEVASATNGSDALQLARESRPDLIITDILMPVMDGYSLCREWQKDESLKSIPMIFYTATYTDPEDERFALKLGAARFVIKPAESDMFLRLIHEVLDEFASGEIESSSTSLHSEEIYLKEYNQTLVRKLEDKLTELQAEIACRKEKEEESQRLITAIEHTSEMVIITDAEGHIQYVNPAFEKVTGYSREDVLGKNPRLLKSLKHSYDFYKGMWEVLNQGETWSGRMINRRKGGTFYTAETNITPIKSPDGEIINFVGISADITKKLAQEEFVRQNQKMEAIGRVVSGVAHDFNNVLQTIKGFSEIMEQDLESYLGGQPADFHDLQRSVQGVQKASGHAQSLTRQLLSISQKKTRDYKETDLNKALSDYHQMLSKTLNREIHLKYELAPDLKLIMADTSQLIQIAMNLIVNARDALEDHGQILVSTQNLQQGTDDIPAHLNSPDGSYICLSVSDCGCGMTEDQAEHLFEPFFTTKELGTGLGLSLVYEIVQELGGAISVASVVGEGSVFTIILPVYHPEFVTKLN